MDGFYTVRWMRSRKPRVDDGARMPNASRSWPTCGLIISRWASNALPRAITGPRKTCSGSRVRKYDTERDDDSQDRQERFRRAATRKVFRLRADELEYALANADYRATR